MTVPEMPPAHVVPAGSLVTVRASDLRPNPANPRRLFDEAPLATLKENIRRHGVLVPLTVYRLPGQDYLGILDGERRYICARDLEAEGIRVDIPANIVDAPDALAGMLFMFNIHNFREAWDLMPTALSLEVVMRQTQETDEHGLAVLTGLDEKQVHRCKILLSFPKKYQEMSLRIDPRTRIPSNLWIELHPVLALYERELPTLVADLTRDGLTDRFVEKYESRRIASVIHLRKILEAWEVAEEQRRRIRERMESFVVDLQLETRATFDEFVAEARRIQSLLRACEQFVDQVRRARAEHLSENRDNVIVALQEAQDLIVDLLYEIRGRDPLRDVADDTQEAPAE